MEAEHGHIASCDYNDNSVLRVAIVWEYWFVKRYNKICARSISIMLTVIQLVYMFMFSLSSFIISIVFISDDILFFYWHNVNYMISWHHQLIYLLEILVLIYVWPQWRLRVEYLHPGTTDQYGLRTIYPATDYTPYYNGDFNVITLEQVLQGLNMTDEPDSSVK